jgi:hypothetical protein
MFTVIAYKPDSEDYCRGCLMSSYPSDMEFICSDNKDEVVEFLAEYKKHNAFLDSGEDGYEFTYLYNGSVATETEENDDPFTEIHRLSYERSLVLISEKREAIRVSKEEALRKFEEDKRAFEIKKYEELKQKYGENA